VYLGMENAPPAYYTVATAWMTAYEVRRFHPTVHRCYFVQDFEPYFYPVGSMSTLCEATYGFGFFGITAGDWLASKLSEGYGMRTSAVGFSCDHQIYRPLPRTDMRPRVLFYGRPSTERRAFELGLLALHSVCEARPEIEVVFVGGRLDDYELPFRHRCEGMLDFHGLATLYSECDAAVVLSMTNASLLPLELMACGVPVISNRAPCTAWLLNDEIAQLAEPTVEGIAGAVTAVMDDPERRTQLKDAGLRAASRTSWDEEGRRMADALRSLG
jgi:O-antigen biosynthesis protein